MLSLYSLLIGLLLVFASPGLLHGQLDQALSEIKGLPGHEDITGKGVFYPTDHGALRIEVEINNAPPGLHGFHIHENGSCADEGKAAGGHFNPFANPHGYVPEDGVREAHAGDLGNILINEEGHGKAEWTVEGLTLNDEPLNVVGKAVILHTNEDKFVQPTGDAGGRIACGIIKEGFNND